DQARHARHPRTPQTRLVSELRPWDSPPVKLYGHPIPGADALTVRVCPVRARATRESAIPRHSATTRNSVLLSVPPSVQEKEPRSRSIACSTARPPSRTRTHRLDRATVFDQREHIPLHLVGELSRLGKAGPLVEATAIAVLALDLDCQVFQALSRELRQPCVEQQHPDAAPLSVRQYVDSRELDRLGRPA